MLNVAAVLCASHSGIRIRSQETTNTIQTMLNQKTIFWMNFGADYQVSLL